MSDTNIGAAKWKWEQSRSRTSGWTAVTEGEVAEYTVDATTDDYYLRATATYKDAEDIDKTAQVVSVNRVRDAPTSADEEPSFPDGTDGTRRRWD